MFFREAISRVPAIATTEVKIGDAMHYFALDTGAENFALDSSLERFATPAAGNVRILAADGSKIRRRYFHGPPLKIQSLNLPRPLGVLIDLQPLSRLWGRKLGGIVGIGELSAGIVSINYDTALFEVHSGSWRLGGSDCHEGILERDERIPTFTATIAGHQVDLGIDSGSDGSLKLPRAVFSALVAEGVIDKGDVAIRGETAGGPMSSERGWFTSGQLMGKNLAGMTVSETSMRNGNVGLQWLCGFNIEIDFPNRKFRYQERKDAKPPVAVQLMTGAILMSDETGARVERLRPGGGAAENAGLKVGDVIESFDSLKPGQMNAVTIGEIVTAKAGTAIPIRFLRKTDGQRVETQLHLPAPISAWDYAGRDIFKAK